MIIITAGG
ncbi:hypothetical protein YPPY03_2922, partial [Yersinia pestis PY-03]